jgi:hypothetical protein
MNMATSSLKYLTYPYAVYLLRELTWQLNQVVISAKHIKKDFAPLKCRIMVGENKLCIYGCPAYCQWPSLHLAEFFVSASKDVFG